MVWKWSVQGKDGLSQEYLKDFRGPIEKKDDKFNFPE